MRSLNHSGDNWCALAGTLTFSWRTHSLSLARKQAALFDLCWRDLHTNRVDHHIYRHEQELLTGCCTDYSTEAAHYYKKLMPTCKLIKDLSVLHTTNIHFPRFTVENEYELFDSRQWAVERVCHCRLQINLMVHLVVHPLNLLASVSHRIQSLQWNGVAIVSETATADAIVPVKLTVCFLVCEHLFVGASPLWSLLSHLHLATKSLSNAITLHCNDSINRLLGLPHRLTQLPHRDHFKVS